MPNTTGITVTAAGLIESIGVNAHLNYGDGNYNNEALVQSELSYLGLNQVRTAFTFSAGSPSISNYIDLANAGVKFDFYITTTQGDLYVTNSSSVTSPSTVVNISSFLSDVDQLPMGSVAAIEGPNEVNNQQTYFVASNGQEIGGITGAVDIQQALYADVKADGNLGGTAVYYFTGYDAYDNSTGSAIGKGPNLATTSGLADFDNQHPYPNNGDAPDVALARASALANTSNPSGQPAVYTETGYSANDVGTDVQAKYTLDLIMDAVSEGISKTYLYELMDAYSSNDGQGLFSYTSNLSDPDIIADTAKPVATAIHNLTSILGGSSGSLNATPLNYTVSNLPSTGNTLAIQESNGDYFVAVWAEPQISTGQTGPAETVTVNLPAGFTASEIYDPLTGTTTSANGQSVNVTVTDHPILVEVTPTQTQTPACFHRGTRVLTAGGDVAVEALRIGDRLVTHSGEIRPIKWIGRRSYSGPAIENNPELAPVCFKAGSLADYIPKTDLWVSAPHTMFIDGVLVPASCLVNDHSIARMSDLREVEYFHLELDSHDVIFAEGAPTETFYDQDGRGMFHNAAEYLDLYPQTGPTPAAAYYAPRLDEGFQLEAIRESLAGRAARLTPDGSVLSVNLRGRLDRADRTSLAGWAQDSLSPDRSVKVVALCNGVELARLDADRYREDLEQAGIGDGRHAFELKWATPFAADACHEIEIRYADTWMPVEGSPLIIEPEEILLSSLVGDLLGHLDMVSSDRITGWALDADHPDRAVGLIVSVNDTVVGRIVANRRRDDLTRQSIGTGRHAFEFGLLKGLSPTEDHVVSVQREIDRVHLPNSPRVLAATHPVARPLEVLLDDVARQTTGMSDPAQGVVLLHELAGQMGSRRAINHNASGAFQELRRFG